jgi:hypothetical protein
MNADPIQAYILKNERNFHIAAAVGAAWPDVRNTIVSGFLDRLDSRLKRKLKGWESDRYGVLFLGKWSGYCISKPEWDEQYYIHLLFGEYGKNMAFGVGRDFKQFGKRPFCDDLLSAVARLHPSARQQKPWWEAQVSMRSPATDWSKPEVLWRAYKDQKFLEDVAEQLLEVAEVSKLIINRLVRKK